MSDSTTIPPFPELRALAEEEARALMCAMHAPEWERRTRSAPRPMPEGWATADAAMLQTLTESHLTLLCDLSRPASRDAVARLVAVRLERSVISVMWALEDTGPSRSGLMLDAGCSDGWLLPPAEALSLIVRHLWPEDSTDAR